MEFFAAAVSSPPRRSHSAMGTSVSSAGEALRRRACSHEDGNGYFSKPILPRSAGRVVVFSRIVVKRILGTIFRALFCLSFGVMIAIGALMAFGLVPAIRGGQASEMIAWETFVHPRQEGVLAKVFFSLSAINLVLIWGWLIHCAARLDFLRLFTGALVGAAIVAALLFLTPSYCARLPEADPGKVAEHTMTVQAR